MKDVEVGCKHIFPTHDDLDSSSSDGNLLRTSVRIIIPAYYCDTSYALMFLIMCSYTTIEFSQGPVVYYLKHSRIEEIAKFYLR